MKVKMEPINGLLRLILEPEENDILEPNEKVSLGSKIVGVHLPWQLDPDTIHPDHLALCIMMITHPFVGKSLTFPKPVSQRFGDRHNSSASRYSIGPVDEELEPWSPSENARPGLAFSGGVDSTASLALMPPATAPIFMDRPLRNNNHESKSISVDSTAFSVALARCRALMRCLVGDHQWMRPPKATAESLYDKDAVHRSCLEVERLGYDMHVIQCDLEYVRSPVGFPVDVANSVPAVLMAEYLNLDCIGFGTIMESTYGTGHRRYRDYPNGHHYSLWGGLFKAAGIPFILPVAGISEVGTSMIVNKAPIGSVAQSCMRGTWKKPCLNCWKCFRKQLLDNAIIDNQLDSNYLDDIFNNKEACLFLARIPIKHENILTWSAYRLESEHVLFSLLKNRVCGDGDTLDWLGKWYSPSIELMPEKYRSAVKDKILCYIPAMDSEDENKLTSWDMNAIIESDTVAQQSETLANEMRAALKPR